MKYLLVVFLVIGSVFAEDATDKMEMKYVGKMEQYKADYDARCRKLTEAYVVELKKIQVAETKKGDLDAALKVKAKIKEMEDILNGIPITIPKTLPGPKVDPIVGEWYWGKRRHVLNLTAKGNIILEGSGGTWRKTAQGTYILMFVTQDKKYPHTVILKKDNMHVQFNNVAFVSSRIVKVSSN